MHSLTMAALFVSFLKRNFLSFFFRPSSSEQMVRLEDCTQYIEHQTTQHSQQDALPVTGDNVEVDVWMSQATFNTQLWSITYTYHSNRYEAHHSGSPRLRLHYVGKRHNKKHRYRLLDHVMHEYN